MAEMKQSGAPDKEAHHAGAPGGGSQQIGGSSAQLADAGSSLHFASDCQVYICEVLTVSF